MKMLITARITVLTVLLSCSLFVTGHPIGNDETINVHLVPHTHDDVGWLKTVDEYFYGDRNDIQHAGVQYILDTVIDELMKNKDRKFIYVEMAFFVRWWNQQDDDTKRNVQQLVQDGQLEFINAGWCMNDEASTHYNAIIDQMSIGLRFVSNTFGVRPYVGWQIDPFGHSSFQATASSLLGYDSLFFARLDYADKALRINQSNMETLWQGSRSLGNVSDIFTGALYAHYGPPKGLCFDSFCSDPPIMDDERLFDYNVKDRVDVFVKEALEQAKHYKTKNIIWTMGSDFQYENAREWFKNLDKLIKYVNINGSVNAMYSTPSMYVQHINDEKDTEWSLKTDDFFPYADAPYHYWTGYFTSRPALKGYVRECNAHLQACKQLEAIHNGLGQDGPSSIKFQQAMGVAQHHDAVSGTEKQHVADDYAKRLHIGQVECENVMSSVLNDLVTKGSDTKMELTFCQHLNVSVCPITDDGDFSMIVYNSLGRPYTGMIHVPVIKESIAVTDPDGNSVPVQIVPISNCTKNLPDFVKTNTSAEVSAVFQVSNVPPLGYSIYTVTPTKGKGNQVSHVHTPTGNDDTKISSKYYEVIFSGKTGHIKSINNIISGIVSNVDQQFYWYNASVGNNVNDSQKSGAYIFRPNSSMAFPVSHTNDAQLSVIEGDIVNEVHQVFAPWLSQVVRLYKNEPYIELEYTVGPIPINDHFGKEIISRFTTDLDTKAKWYTDANGRDIQERVRNYRPTWKYNDTDPIAGNYYPVNSRIFIRDNERKVQFTVLNDRSQGGSSINDGSVELMIHRRLLQDDNRGVGEPLNETGINGDGLVIRGKHLVIFDNIDNSTYCQRMEAEKLMMTPQLVFAKNSLLKQEYTLKYSELFTALPDNVHLLTLERLDDSTILLRLDHQFEADELHPWSDTVNVKLSDLFVSFTIKDVTELGLGGNVALSEIKKLQWKTTDNEIVPDTAMNLGPAVTGPDYTVSLSPMMIRTFNVSVEFKKETIKHITPITNEMPLFKFEKKMNQL